MKIKKKHNDCDVSQFCVFLHIKANPYYYTFYLYKSRPRANLQIVRTNLSHLEILKISQSKGFSTLFANHKSFDVLQNSTFPITLF